MWVVVKITVPFSIPIIIPHLILGYPKKANNFDKHLCRVEGFGFM